MPVIDEAVAKKILPHDLKAEQAVIGSMIMDKDAIALAAEVVTGDDFYSRQYGLLFDIMVDMNKQGVPVDEVTLQAHFKDNDVPDELSSLDFLRDVIAAVPSSTNAKHYAQIVAEKSLLRKLIKVNEEIASSCYSGKEETSVLLEETEKKVFNLVQRRNTGDIVPIKQIVLDAMEQIETASKTKGAVTGLSTGFIDLDRMTAGLHPSDLVIVAARPAMGKTAFVLNIAQHMAFRQNKKVAIFSLEMGREQLAQRLFSMESKVDSQNIRTGNLSDVEWQKLIEAMDVVAKSNMIIDDTSGITISELQSKCRKYKLEHGLDIVLIDYLQLMSGSGKNESRQQEISDISRALKGLARELKIPVIALSQLSRTVESREDKRPMLSDLRESGAIEQDADVVMFIYRDEYYNHDSTEHRGEAEIIIAKQRSGPVGTVKLAWLGQYTQFANLAK